MENSDYTILGRKVVSIYPEIAKNLTIEPLLSDLRLIPLIFEKMPLKCEKDARFIFIGVILSLYDPDVLNGFKTNLRYGVRGELAKIFKISETVISHNLQTVRNYYMIYRKFKTSVDYISHQISEEYACRS